MKNVTKLTSTFTYPAKGKGQPAITVGFFLDSRLDRYGNVLRRVNITDKFGEIHNVEYSGKSLMVSVETSAKTTSVRRATRQDLLKYKEAYSSYLEGLTTEDRKLHEDKIYLFLEELPSSETKKETSGDANKELEKAKAEIEALRTELEKTKIKPAKAKSAKSTEELEKTE